MLADARGRNLPRCSAGAHIDVVADDYRRKYSLCGEPEARDRLEITVLREAAG